MTLYEQREYRLKAVGRHSPRGTGMTPYIAGVKTLRATIGECPPATTDHNTLEGMHARGSLICTRLEVKRQDSANARRKQHGSAMQSRKYSEVEGVFFGGWRCMDSNLV